VRLVFVTKKLLIQLLCVLFVCQFSVKNKRDVRHDPVRVATVRVTAIGGPCLINTNLVRSASHFPTLGSSCTRNAARHTHSSTHSHSLPVCPPSFHRTANPTALSLSPKSIQPRQPIPSPFSAKPDQSPVKKDIHALYISIYSKGKENFPSSQSFLSEKKSSRQKNSNSEHKIWGSGRDGRWGIASKSQRDVWPQGMEGSQDIRKIIIGQFLNGWRQLFIRQPFTELRLVPGHPTDATFDRMDQGTVLDRARDAGVRGVIDCGFESLTRITSKSVRSIVKIANRTKPWSHQTILETTNDTS